MTMEKKILTILNVPSSLVFMKENDLDKYLALSAQAGATDKKCACFSRAIVALDKFHSYFHFEQSFVLTILAYICNLKGDKKHAIECADKAIFQDPLNYVAKNFLKRKPLTWNAITSYDKHFKYEKDFLEFVGGEFKPHAETDILDKVIQCLFDKKTKKKLPAKHKKIVSHTKHTSHRVNIARAVMALNEKKLADSHKHITQALKKLEEAHKAYHQYASMLYKKRADLFNKLGQIDLAKNDLIRAENLFPTPCP